MTSPLDGLNADAEFVDAACATALRVLIASKKTSRAVMLRSAGGEFVRETAFGVTRLAGCNVSQDEIVEHFWDYLLSLDAHLDATRLAEFESDFTLATASWMLRFADRQVRKQMTGAKR